ncbi:MAG: chemotaxis response regulator protein-glutamate methylesterase [Spirochaetes bacterium]|nr:chemotaxis response regulator protein-glutamate methylesterase [Spirochaetota bacterium]
MKKIKVIIVDDSISIRTNLKKKLSKIDDIEVVATAPDPYAARDKIVLLNPDIIILDIEMPKMDGLTFLEKIMNHFPKPVIIFSSFTTKGSKLALKALELGAVEVISKSDLTVGMGQSSDFIDDLKMKIYSAYNSKIQKTETREEVAEYEDINIRTTDKIVVIGASTGGTEAIKKILTPLPENFPGIVIVQHMPPNFTTRFAERLDELCRIKVKEAEDGDQIVQGQALIAPGDQHILINKNGKKLYVTLNSGPKVHFQRPSVDILFKSASKVLKDKAIGIILTGMGRDGASGLLELKKAGAQTLAQDRESSIVYGMPEEAVKIGAVDYELDIYKIPEKLIEILNK